MGVATETKFGTRVAWGEDDVQTSNTCIAHACTQKAHATTLDDEKYNWPYTGAVHIDWTCIVVTALCNQPEAFASDLGDDHQRPSEHFTLILIYCVSKKCPSFYFSIFFNLFFGDTMYIRLQNKHINHSHTNNKSLAAETVLLQCALPMSEKFTVKLNSLYF